MAAASAIRLGHIVLDGDDIYWVEGRPDEGGRSVVVRRRPDGTTADITPDGANVRSTVHESGGAAYTVLNGTIYFSEFTDQRLYRLSPGGRPEAMTPAGPWRYADATLDPARARLVCVREDHTRSDADAEAALVALPLDGPVANGEIVRSGCDFYSTPRFNPDASRIVWLEWRHPRMPWDGTELWMAEVGRDGRFVGARKIAGGETESIVQPGWSPDGALCFMSDRTGWWNLYRGGLDGAPIEPVYPIDADCARPQWMFGSSTWAFAGPSTLVVACCTGGRWKLVELEVRRSETARVSNGRLLTDVEPGELLAANGRHLVFVGGSPSAPDSVMRVALPTRSVETIRQSASFDLETVDLSIPQAIEFPTDGGQRAHAFYYAPTASSSSSEPATPPPLMVMSHGGPTGQATARLNLEVQFWSGRGFAIVDVNYGGSSGFGRRYRERLDEAWGIVDVADCVNAVRHLVAQRLADPRRVVIRGRSAGGFTTLGALARQPDLFAAGASYYGVGDLDLLARDTHKFESHYLDRLVGAYPARRDRYLERSPVHHLDGLASPLILFHGLDDRVVPPAQSDQIVAAAAVRGRLVALVAFAGEGHGFRSAETIATCLDVEAAFYERVFERLQPAG